MTIALPERRFMAGAIRYGYLSSEHFIVGSVERQREVKVASGHGFKCGDASRATGVVEESPAALAIIERCRHLEDANGAIAVQRLEPSFTHRKLAVPGIADRKNFVANLEIAPH